jgi:transcriptional regulator with XRE-family HTH domain
LETLRHRVRELRLEAGLSKEHLARSANVSLSLINRIELAGHIPRADRLLAIARALGVGLDALLPAKDEVA